MQKPPKATTAGGTTKVPAVTLTARARQTGSGGAVSASVACSRGCRVTLSGTAAAGGKRIKLATTRRTLLKPATVRVRIVLPAEARRALAGRRPVVVRLTLRAAPAARHRPAHHRRLPPRPASR